MLGDIATGELSGTPIRFTRQGFAAPARGDRSARRAAPWLAAAAVLALLVGGVLAWPGSPEEVQLAAVENPTTTTTTEATTTTTEPAITTTTTTEAPTTTTVPVAAPTTAPAAPPSSDNPVVVPPPPPPDTTPPVISDLQSSRESIQTSCAQAGHHTTISATVTDGGALSSVQLRWQGAPGSGHTPMSASGSTYAAQLPPGAPFESAGQLTYTVRAIDLAGNVATVTDTIWVLPCPQ